MTAGRTKSPKEDIALKVALRRLYFGSDIRARRFRNSLLALDVLLLLYFVVGSFYPYARWHLVVDLCIALVLTLEFLLRFTVFDLRLRVFRQIGTWVDVAVIISLVVPAFTDGFLFLRVLRFMRLFHSYHVLNDLREQYEVFRRNEEIIDAAIKLAIFVFLMSAVVYILQARTNPGIENYVDALYFTVTTLTTTGFGDIVVKDTTGRLLAVAIMIVGFGFFLRLVQTAFRPRARRVECETCGLSRHELDAIHCKHCGHVLKIKNKEALEDS